MTLVRHGLVLAIRHLAIAVSGAALVAACSGATSSPSGPAANRSEGPTGAAATPTPATTIAPTSAPTAAPTAAPSVEALPPELNAGTPGACDPTDTGKHCETPGTYRLTGGPDVWPVLVTMDVPAGWFEPEPGTGFDLVIVNNVQDAGYSGGGWGVQFATVGDVYRDPCDVSKGTIPAARVATPQKLAAAIAAWPGFAATATEPIAVDGHRGLEFTLSRTAKPCGTGTSWLSASNGPVNAYPFASGRKYATTIRIVDTGHGLLVIRAVDYLDTSPWELGLGVAQSATRHAADQPKLQAILNSIRLTDWPAST